MNYAAKFGLSASDSHSSAHVDIDSLSHRGHADTVTIPDAHLLFSGDYQRSGADLIVSDHDHRVVVPDYFHGDKRPTLVSPEGAPLDPKVIEALTGHVQYAQAAGTAPAAKVVGHVVKMTGSASIVRNGVTIDLNNGDTVYQNDVVQTGSGSTLGLVLIDGTTFNMTANARLMLNDLTYDANSASNTSLFTLVQGAASFVAGQVAKTGDMKVATPVATMGIRGTAFILDISAVDGKVSISVIDQHDGRVHAVQVFNTRGDLIGTVTSSGTGLTLTPTATFEVIAQESNKTVAQVAQEFNAFQTLLQTYDAGKALFPDLPQHTDNANPQSPTKYAGSPSLNSPGTEHHSPANGGPAGQNLNNGSGTPIVVTYQSPGVGPIGLPSSQLDPIIRFETIRFETVVPVTKLPFVVTPSPISKISSGSGDHFGPVMSADGRFVTYDPDGAIFLYDRQSNTAITIASPGNGLTYTAPTVSSDGRYIVFQGSNGTQSFVFTYVNDPTDAHYKQTTQLGSVSSPVSGSSPAISGNGSTIVVENGGSSIGIYDLQGHLKATITPALIGSSGTIWKPSISADGHVIAFWSSNLPTAGGAGQLYTYNLSTGTIAAIASTATGAGTSAASISADGHYLVVQSDAPELFGTPGTHSTEIFLYDLATGKVIFSTASAAGASYNPVISPDGHFIIFASDAKLTSNGTNSIAQTYVVDITDPSHPVYKLVSALPDGTPGSAASDLGASISAGGLFVVFGSSATNLSTGYSGKGNIFVVDPSSGRTAIIQESASSPSQIMASGVIPITGDVSGVQLTVSHDPSVIGTLSAIFRSDGNIVWTYQAQRLDFSFLHPGQLSNQNFVINLSTGSSTSTIPIKVSVYDADQPTVVVNSLARAPNLSVTAASGNEGTAGIALNISSSQVDTNLANANLSLSVAGLLGGKLNHGTLNADGSYTLHSADLASLIYTPEPEFTGVVALRVTATDTEGSSHTSASSLTQTLNVTINPVAEAPSLSVTAASGSEGTAGIALNISSSQVETDLANANLSLTISDLQGGKLNHGTLNADGSYTLHSADLASLIYMPAPEFTGVVALRVTATDTEGSSHTSASSPTQILNVTINPVGHGPGIAYMTGTSDPWGISPSDQGSPDAAMNVAFGTGNWTKFQGFSNAALSDNFHFLYIDGGDGTSSGFNSFIRSHIADLQNFVDSGGHLVINAARWDQPALDLGFGVTLSSGFSPTGSAINPANPLFHGPFGDAGSNWSGNYFSHDVVNGVGLNPLVSGTAGTVLADEHYGTGYIMVGGITDPYFHWPQHEADVLRANMLYYADHIV